MTEYRLMSREKDTTPWSDATIVDIEAPLYWSMNQNEGNFNPFVAQYVSVAAAIGDETIGEHPDEAVYRYQLSALYALDTLIAALERYNNEQKEVQA